MTQPDPTDLSQEGLDALVAAAEQAFAAAGTLAELKAARLAHVDVKSPLAGANRAIGSLPGPERAAAGARIGAAKGAAATALAARTEVLEAERDARILVEEAVDVTVPVGRRPLGARHPLELISERIADVFVAMGWEVAEGPEVEAEWLNFDALNIGPDHPARQMQDTFFVEPPDSHLVLRTHTSPVQARTMLHREPPIYVVCPGKTFRTDDLDATHTPVFHQVEALAVDKGITMAHLKGTLDAFVRAIFGPDMRTRLRPSYFPFTEPSAEIDCSCFACNGTAALGECRVCGGSGWIELGGSGMVNRKVLTACGIDPDVYTGFAFGLGIERTLMLRHGVATMYDMIDGDVRFSSQFGLEL